MNIYSTPYWLLPSEHFFGELRAVEVRFNPHHDEKGRFCSGNRLDKSHKSGIIKAGSDTVHISAIEQPIEQKHTGKGNPNAILIFDVELNARQQKLLEQLPEYDSRAIVSKESVNMADLSALTAKTGDEFAMFTKGNKRMIARGNYKEVNIDPKEAYALSKKGYKWSGHTHPGDSFICMQPSDGDYSILDCFNQEQSVIYNSKGNFRTFEKKRVDDDV